MNEQRMLLPRNLGGAVKPLGDARPPREPLAFPIPTEAPLGLRINLTVATFLNGNLFVFTGATSMSSAFSPKNLIAWDVVEAPDGPVLIQWDRIILGESRLDWPAR